MSQQKRARHTAWSAGEVFCPLALGPEAYTPKVLIRCSASGPLIIKWMTLRLAALRFFVSWWFSTLNERSHVATHIDWDKENMSISAQNIDCTPK